MGSIDLTRKGLDETFSKNPEKGTIFPDLVEHLKNADFFETNQLYKARKDSSTKQFHVLKDKNNKYYIAEDKQGNKKFYLAKSTTADQGTPSRVEGTSSGGSALGSSPAYSHQKRAHELEPNNIIPNSADDFNLAQPAIPPLILSQLEIFKDEAPTAMFNLGIEMNVYAEGNKILWKQEPDKIFTREEIGKMSIEEYTKNERAIFAQLQNIGIPEGKNEPQNSERKTKTPSKSKGTAEIPPGKHWVTINGNHVLLDN